MLIGKISDALKVDYDWTADIERITAPDAARVRRRRLGRARPTSSSSSALLGGGLRDAGWDSSAQPANQLAVLPGRTHYDVYLSPALAPAVAAFLDAPPR